MTADDKDDPIIMIAGVAPIRTSAYRKMINEIRQPNALWSALFPAPEPAHYAFTIAKPKDAKNGG